MKKTLIALMALAGVASASLTLDSTLTGITKESNTYYSWASDQSSAAVTLILTATSLNQLSGDFTSGSFNEGLASFILTGGSKEVTVDNETQNKTIGQITLEHKQDDNPKGIRVSDTIIGTSWGSNIMGTAFTTSVYDENAAWNTAKSAAITFALDAQGNTCTLLSVIDVNGVITNIGTATVSTGVSFTGIDALQLNKNERIAEAYVYSGEWTATDLTKVTSDALWKQIPEPTTATLSLLALAGLAARRRRK